MWSAHQLYNYDANFPIRIHYLQLYRYNIYIYQSIYRVAEKKFDPFLYTITLTSVDGIKKKYAFDKETILPKVIAKTDRKYI